MKTGGTGVVGMVVTFGTMPVVFTVTTKMVGTAAGSLVPSGGVPGVVLSRAAQTPTGSARMMMHTTATISRNPEAVLCTWRIEKPFFCSLEISSFLLLNTDVSLPACETGNSKPGNTPSGFFPALEPVEYDSFTRLKSYTFFSLPFEVTGTYTPISPVLAPFFRSGWHVSTHSGKISTTVLGYP
jgi:hypothetical protein